MILSFSNNYRTRLSKKMIRLFQLRNTDRLQPLVYSELEKFVMRVHIVRNTTVNSKPRNVAELSLPKRIINKMGWKSGDQLIEVLDRSPEYFDCFKIEKVDA